MNYGMKIMLTPDVFGKMEKSLPSIGRMIQFALTRKLEEDNLLDTVKQEGMVLEVYLKDITPKEATGE